MRTLFLLGIVTLLLARRFQTLVLLLTVPVYYIAVQSPLHTEYRYVLAIHYFLFVLAGSALAVFGMALAHSARGAIRRSRSSARPAYS